jgi:hypothetical protein
VQTGLGPRENNGRILFPAFRRMDAVSAASEAKLGLGMAGNSTMCYSGACAANSGIQGFSPGEFITGTLLRVFSMIEASKENPESYIMFIVFLTFWTTIAAPVTPVEIGGGCVFGPVWGTLGSLIGKTLGCFFALCIGRVFGKDWKMPSALEPYLDGIRKRPFVVMSLIRLAPIPLGVKNYGLSLVRFPEDRFPYLIYTASCFAIGAPFSVFWGNLGAGFSSVAEALAKK